MSLEPHLPSNPGPLYVDVDGTLLRTDLLYESIASVAARAPWMLLLVPFWLLRGKAHLKQRLAEAGPIDASQLPRTPEIVRLIEEEVAKGREVILASASYRPLVEEVAKSTPGVAPRVIASDGVINMRGGVKRDALIADAGGRNFGYVGNDFVDLPVWEIAAEPIVCAHSPRVANAAKTAAPRVRVITPHVLELPSISVLLRALRVHQWVKNALLLLPALMAHRLFELPVLAAVIVGSAAFSLCASAVYLMNDLIDLDADRQHPTKRFRPFASGTLPLKYGLLLVPSLLVASAMLAVLLPLPFQLILLGYFLLTTAYSLLLKRVVLLDIITLALLYAVRVLAGGFAAQVHVSQWLLGFSLFIFVSLAAVKRFSELYGLRQQNRDRTAGRGYVADDLESIAQMGAASGYVAVLVMALYISSTEVVKLYAHPQALWLVCPVLLYWISRVWLLAHRGEMHDDPIVFALRDRVSYLVGVAILLVILFAL